MVECATVTVLVVEDDPETASVLSQLVDGQGWESRIATTAADAAAALESKVPDLVLLDVVLPDGDGRDICRAWRDAGISVPVLFVTGLTGPDEAIAAFEAGGDGFVSKPFHVDVLCAHVRALLRRRPDSRSPQLTYADLQLDVPARKVVRAGKPVRLSEREFQLLAYMVQHSERVVSRGEITVRVWDMETPPTSNVVDVCVWSLRRKIDQSFDEPLIHTVKGLGYRLGLAQAEDDL